MTISRRWLSGRSRHELYSRGRQVASRIGERWLGWQRNPPVVAPRLRRPQQAGGLQLGAHDVSEAVSTIRARWPADVSALLERADAALLGRFRLLGYDGVAFGNPIDWRLDPLRGKRSPLRHWSQIPYLDVEAVGDHKLVWELNRHAHFVTLAQAYCLTGEPRYLDGLEAQWRQWIDQNPLTRGINWASSLEVAFRAIHWLWSARLARAAGAERGFWDELPRWLMAHGGHVERYLSTYFSPNTHLTGEALGLLYLGCWLEECETTKRWRDTGWRVLCRELERQLHPDGVYFEQTTWYQRYTADFYLHAWLLAADAGLSFPARFHERVAGAVDVLLHLTRPDGSTPLIGDDDGGQLLALDAGRPDDFRDTLALAALVMDRADYRFGAGHTRSALVWLLGPAAADVLEGRPAAAPAPACRAFAVGGYYSIRDGWSADASHMVIDAGPHGALAAGHSHADALSFDLTLEGARLLVDPGTVSYVGPEREWFRSTAAHNTASVDGRSSSEPAGIFRWSRWARTTVEAWCTRDWASGLAAWHDGYQRLPDPVLHYRAVLFVGDGCWLVLDRFTARGAHRIKLRYQTAAGVRARPAGPGRFALRAPRGGGEATDAALWLSGPGEAHSSSAMVSSVYGAQESASAIDLEIESVGSTALLALAGPARCLRGAALEGGAVPGGWSWRLQGGDRADVVVLTERGGSVGAAGLEVEDGVCWLRRDAAGAPVALVGLGPHGVTVDEVRHPAVERSVLARAAGGQLRADG